MFVIKIIYYVNFDYTLLNQNLNLMMVHNFVLKKKIVYKYFKFLI